MQPDQRQHAGFYLLHVMGPCKEALRGLPGTQALLLRCAASFRRANGRHPGELLPDAVQPGILPAPCLLILVCSAACSRQSRDRRCSRPPRVAFPRRQHSKLLGSLHWPGWVAICTATGAGVLNRPAGGRRSSRAVPSTRRCRAVQPCRAGAALDTGLSQRSASCSRCSRLQATAWWKEQA